jgi:small subunit ribosomal protein S6
LATANYECLYILDSNRYAQDPGGVATALQQSITELGGEILASRLWAEQKLAYPINGHQKGTYWLIYFHFDTLKLRELNRANQLNESIVRSMVVRVDPRLIDALVAHAMGRQLEPVVEPADSGEVAAEEASDASAVNAS